MITERRLKLFAEKLQIKAILRIEEEINRKGVWKGYQGGADSSAPKLLWWWLIIAKLDIQVIMHYKVLISYDRNLIFHSQINKWCDLMGGGVLCAIWEFHWMVDCSRKIPGSCHLPMLLTFSNLENPLINLLVVGSGSLVWLWHDYLIINLEDVLI